MMAARKKPLRAVDGVEADLRALPAPLAGSGLAASALALARKLDDGETSATAAAACTRSLVTTMRELRSLAPAKEEVDRLDELTRRREARAAG
jgi:hypothetical protein